MTDRPDPQVSERRDSDRLPFDGEIVIEVDAQTLRGEGQNQSDQGVFCTLEELPRVRVQTPDGERLGEIVRIQTQSGGRAGVAVRLLD